jgi:hypothetical protein
MNLLYAIVFSFGMIDGGLMQYQPIDYTSIEIPFYTDIDCDIQYGPFFGVAKIHTDIYMKSIAKYVPFQNTYIIGGGVRVGNVEIGVTHACYHPMQPYQWSGDIITPHFEGGITNAYISLTLSNY